MLLTFVNPSKSRPAPVVGIAVAAVLFCGVAAGGYYAWHRSHAGSDASLITADRLYAIEPMRLDIAITQPGELQAVVNIDLICRVERGTTITDIVKEGSYVTKGQTLVTFDSAPIRQQIDDMTLELQRAEAAVLNAREMLAIQDSNNSAELEGGEVGLQLAEVEFKKYVEGTFPQEEKTAATKLDMAKIDLQNKQDDLAQSKNLFTRGFVTATDVKEKELAVTQAKNAVDEADTTLRVLRDYSHEADLAAKQNAVAQAKSKLERVKRQNESMINQKTADLNAAQQQLALRQRLLHDLNDQLAFCTIVAPENGMVVYSNDPDRQQIIQEGTEVRERQSILRLPDTSTMKSVLKLNEAQANRVRVGMRATIQITGIAQPVSGTVTKVSIVPASGQRWMNPDAKEYPAEVTLDATPPELKPSTSVKTTILINSIPNALAVRLDSIYSVGYETYVFVDNGQGGVGPRKVKLGESSLTHAEVLDGLTTGERVLILGAGEGKRLLEQAGIKLDPATQPAAAAPQPAATPGADAPAAAARPQGAAGAGSGAPGGEGRRRRGTAEGTTQPATP